MRANAIACLALLGFAAICSANDIKRADSALMRGDYPKAVEFLSKLAADGNATAQVHLGRLYQRGEGVDRDAAMAFSLYLAAAEQGHADAQFNVANMYIVGDGVPQDEDWALTFYRLAAEQGHFMAERNMRELLRANGGDDLRDSPPADPGVSGLVAPDTAAARKVTESAAATTAPLTLLDDEPAPRAETLPPPASEGQHSADTVITQDEQSASVESPTAMPVPSSASADAPAYSVSHETPVVTNADGEPPLGTISTATASEYTEPPTSESTAPGAASGEPEVLREAAYSSGEATARADVPPAKSTQHAMVSIVPPEQVLADEHAPLAAGTIEVELVKAEQAAPLVAENPRALSERAGHAAVFTTEAREDEQARVDEQAPVVATRMADDPMPMGSTQPVETAVDDISAVEPFGVESGTDTTGVSNDAPDLVADEREDATMLAMDAVEIAADNAVFAESDGDEPARSLPPVGPVAQSSADETTALGIATSHGIRVKGAESVGQTTVHGIVPAPAPVSRGTMNPKALQALYEDAHGALADGRHAEAITVLRELVAAGHGDAAMTLADLHANGRGVERSADMALQWRRQAATFGNAAAQFELGTRYEQGRGVTADEAMAITWYREAARSGHAEARDRLRALYEKAGMQMPDLTAPRAPVSIESGQSAGGEVVSDAHPSGHAHRAPVSIDPLPQADTPAVETLAPATDTPPANVPRAAVPTRQGETRFA